MAKLTAINGDSAGQVYPISSENIMLGRQHDCDIVLNADTVSRQHAKIYLIGRQFFVEDLHSQNGTYVNNRRLTQPVLLNPDDNIRLGDVSFNFINNDTHNHSKKLAKKKILSSDQIEISESDDQTGTVILSRVGLSENALHDPTHAVDANDKLNALLEVMHNLTRSQDLDEVMPRLLDSLFNIFPKSERGFIVIKNRKGELIPKWSKLRHAEQNQCSISISRMIIEQAIANQTAILSEDAGADQRFDASQSIINYQIHTVICAPLINSEGEPFGVIQLDSLKRGQRFLTNELQLLAGVAVPAALAINNANLFEQALQQQQTQLDLELANQVQCSFLPGSKPQLTDYYFFNYYQPANHIGGDFYDYINMPNQCVAVIVADVAGHGIAAALLMAKLSVHIRYCLEGTQEPVQIMQNLNQRFYLDNMDDRFVTLVMVILNPQLHQFTVVNAGHMAPFIWRQEGIVERIGVTSTGLPLGVLANTEYQQSSSTLEPGELILMNTDGINEAQNYRGEFFGESSITTIIDSHSSNPDQLGLSIISDLKNFCGDEPNADDICLVYFSRKQ